MFRHKTNSSMADNRGNSVPNKSPMCLVHSLHLVVVADRSGHSDLDGDTDLSRNRVANLSGDLTRVLDWPLLALPLSAGVALGSGDVAVMSVAGLGLPLAVAVSCVATRVHLRVVADHTRAVVHLLGHLVALLSHDILALLDVGGVHNSIVLSVACLVVLGVAGGVNFGVVFSMAVCVVDSIGVATMSLSVVVGGIARGSRGKPGKGNKESEAQHLFSENIFPPVIGAEAICEFSILRCLLALIF